LPSLKPKTSVYARPFLAGNIHKPNLLHFFEEIPDNYLRPADFQEKKKNMTF